MNFLCSHFKVEDGRKYTFSEYYAILLQTFMNATEMQKMMCSVYGGGAVMIERVGSCLRSFLVLLTFWPNNSLLWGCIMHWKMFSSTFGPYLPEANSGR